MQLSRQTCVRKEQQDGNQSNKPQGYYQQELVNVAIEQRAWTIRVRRAKNVLELGGRVRLVRWFGNVRGDRLAADTGFSSLDVAETMS